jgi:putative membrane protein
MHEAVAFIGGLILGFLSGLLPGLHSNTIISVLSSLGMDDKALAVMIIALFPVHLVTSFIPSIFFGIPESHSVVAVLPGQRMVLRGEGMDALKTVLLSCVVAALLSAALFRLSIDAFPVVYDALRANMKFILLGVSSVLLLRSKNPMLSILVFMASGMLGHYSLNSGMQDPFLPMFSGMFAMSAILNYRKSKVPLQKEKPVSLGFLNYSLLGVLLGFLADLIPGVGSPSQVATFASIFVPFNSYGYLAAVSSISVSEAIFSLATSASIGKSRVGATAWLAESMDIGENMMLLLPLFVLAMAIAVAVLYSVRRRIAMLASMDFSRLNAILGLYLISMTVVLDGAEGLVVLVMGSVLGLVTLRLGVERINLMGAIILPTLLLLFRILV